MTVTNKKKSQKDNILAHLKSGNKISPIEALQMYGCFRLADVIFRLKKDGFKFEVDNTNKYAIYSLVTP